MMVAAQQLEERLGDLAQPERRELREIDRDDGAQRDRDRQRHHRAGERARKEHHDAEVRVVEERRPLPVGEEVQQRDVLEEHHRFLEQDVDDAHGGEHRHQRGEKQEALDDPLAHDARAAPGEAQVAGFLRQGGRSASRSDGRHGKPRILNEKKQFHRFSQ
jgi:hypothetical protein